MLVVDGRKLLAAILREVLLVRVVGANGIRFRLALDDVLELFILVKSLPNEDVYRVSFTLAVLAVLDSVCFTAGKLLKLLRLQRLVVPFHHGPVADHVSCKKLRHGLLSVRTAVEDARSSIHVRV